MMDRPGHIIDDLRKAIDEHAIEVYYQPQVKADGYTVAGVEALVRLRLADGTLLQPGEFVSKIEANLDAATILGDLILEQACADARNWPDITIGVNVAPLRCAGIDFADQILSRLEEARFDPHRLEIEILESSWFANARVAVETLRTLRSAGVSIALDDFGTGYASLSALLELPLTKLKIDRSFVSNCHEIRSASIIHAIVALAKAIGIKVTAEGVENKNQARFLRVTGCHFLQGYYFSPPLSATEMTAFFDRAAALSESA